MTKTAPVVILALDVGSPDLLVGWARAGYLPTLARLLERGCWGRAAGPELVCEHGTWLSMLSGVSRRRHGFYHFRQLRPGTYELQPFSVRDTGVRPFWHALRGGGQRVAVLDLPETLPLPELPGVQLAHWSTHEPPLPATSEPPEFLAEVGRRYGPTPLILGEQFNSTAADDRRIYQGLLAQLAQKGKLYASLLAEGPFDLWAMAFSEAHTASHQFWKYVDTADPNRAAGPGDGELTHALRDIYQAIDAQMAALLAALPEANVFVVSLLGMQPMYPSSGLTENFCQRLGYQRPRAASASPLNLARRLVPKPVRMALSKLLPRGAQEQLLTSQLLTGTDWAQTTAFAIPGWDASFLRVNLRGREPQGSVEPGADYAAVLARLEADLAQLVDPRTNASPIRRVARTVDLYGGGPPAALPDLFVEWEPSAYFRDRVMHPRGDLTQPVDLACAASEETPVGFIGAMGPDITGRGELGEIGLLDLAPTWLSLLGRPAPPELTGRPIEGLARR